MVCRMKKTAPQVGQSIAVTIPAGAQVGSKKTIKVEDMNWLLLKDICKTENILGQQVHENNNKPVEVDQTLCIAK